MGEKLASIKKVGGGGEKYEMKYLSSKGASYNSTSYSFNIKTLLPNYYDKLTVDDFFIIPTSVNVHWYTNPASGCADTATIFSKNYNASTGVLSGACGVQINQGSSNYHCYVGMGFNLYALVKS